MQSFVDSVLHIQQALLTQDLALVLTVAGVSIADTAEVAAEIGRRVCISMELHLRP